MPRRREWRIVLTAMLLGAVAIPLLASHRRDSDLLSERAGRVAALPVAERERLERNYAVWQNLDHGARRKLAAIDSAVRADAEAGGDLGEVLENYYGWLKTLSASQRIELSSETDPEARLALVRKFKTEERSSRERGSWGWGSGSSRRPYGGSSSARDDLQPLIKAALERMPALRNRRELLDSKPEYRQLLAILQAVVWMEPEGRTASVRRAIIDDLIAAIPNEERREAAQKPSQTESRRQALAQYLLRATFLEIQSELRRSRPTEEQIQEFFTRLDSARRAELTNLGLAPDEIKGRLVMMYSAEHNAGIRQDLHALRELQDENRALFGDRRWVWFPQSRGDGDRRSRRGSGESGRRPPGPPGERGPEPPDGDPERFRPGSRPPGERPSGGDRRPERPRGDGVNEPRPGGRDGEEFRRPLPPPPPRGFDGRRPDPGFDGPGDRERPR